MSPVPEFILEIRRMIGTHPLWLPGVTAVVRRDDEVLMVRRADNGAWTPVTGIVDPGEEPAVAAAREALEETGVVIRVDRLASTSATGEVVYANGDRASYLDLTFACTWISGQAHVADDESTDVRWFPVNALPPMSEAMSRRVAVALADEREARFVGGEAEVAATPGPEVLRPSRPVLGVDACATGWVGVLLDEDARPTVHVAATITDLLALVRERVDPAVVAIDIPRAATGGASSASAQAYPLATKVLEVDAWLRSGPGTAVVEVPPELSFARMAGAPILARKTDSDGVRARREALRRHGICAPPWFRGSGFAEDDLLDACAAAWSAARHERGVCESFPTTPEVFGDGTTPRSGSDPSRSA